MFPQEPKQHSLGRSKSNQAQCWGKYTCTSVALDRNQCSILLEKIHWTGKLVPLTTNDQATQIKECMKSYLKFLTDTKQRNDQC